MKYTSGVQPVHQLVTQSPSIANLSPTIRINNKEMETVFRYNARDATDVNWRPDGFGEVLTRTPDVWYQQAKLVSGDGAGYDFFGNVVTVSANGDRLVVGTPYDDDSGSNSGSAYVFEKNDAGWFQRVKLVASDAASGDQFGFSAFISGAGNVVVVGSHLDDDGGADSGSAYVFRRAVTGVWTQEAKLVASDAAAGDHFGFGVSIAQDGNTVLVGARYKVVDSTARAGAAYVFVSDGEGGWTQQAKLVRDVPVAQSCFGYSVALSVDGDIAVIGSPNDTTQGTDAGCAHVFSRDGDGVWTQTIRLLASDGAATRLFGFFVAIAGDSETIAVGAPWFHAIGGAVYVFAYVTDAWTQQAKLFDDTITNNGHLGYSVSFSADGNLLVVGAPYTNNPVLVAGKIVVFSREGTAWTLQARLVLLASYCWDYFGFTVGVSADGSVIVTGCPLMASGTTSIVGAVYVFAEGSGVQPRSRGLLSGVRDDAIAVSSARGFQAAVAGFADYTVEDLYLEYDFCVPDDFFVGTYTVLLSKRTYTLYIDYSGYLTFRVTGRFGGAIAVCDTPLVAGGNYFCSAYAQPTAAAPYNIQLYVHTIPGSVLRGPAMLWPAGDLTASHFGVSVAVSASVGVSVVGASKFLVGGVAVGAVFVFRKSVANVWEESACLFAGGTPGVFNFGSSVALSADGTVLVVGAPLCTVSGGSTNTGAAYVFRYTEGGGWSAGVQVLASGNIAHQFMGGSCAISANGTTFVAGSGYWTGAAQGKAYVFVYEDGVWVEQAALVGSDSVVTDRFSTAVSLAGDGNTCLVSAGYAALPGKVDAGAAYIFERDGEGVWTQRIKLASSDIAANDYFGDRVAISGDGNTCCLGAFGDDFVTVVDSGSAYVFVRSGGTWVQQAKVSMPTVRRFYDYFGFGVALSYDGNVLAVSATFAQEAFWGGTVYLHTRSGSSWTLQRAIVPPEVVVSSSAARALGMSLDGSVILIGSYSYSTTGGAFILSPEGTLGSLENASVFTLGARYDGVRGCEAAIRYVLMAKGTGIYAGGAQNVVDWAAFHRERYYAVYGLQHAGSAALSYSCASTLLVPQIDEAGQVLFHTVGAHGVGVSRWLSSFYGFLGEGSANNWIRQSVRIDLWSTRALLSLPTLHRSPIKGKFAFKLLDTVDAGNDSHRVACTAVTTGNTSGQICFYVVICASGTEDWVWIRPSQNGFVSNNPFTVYVNLRTEVFGTQTGTLYNYGVVRLGVLDGIDWKLLYFRGLSGHTSSTQWLNFYTASGNGSANYQGDGTRSVYLAYGGMDFGTDLEGSLLPILTGGATVTRVSGSSLLAPYNHTGPFGSKSLRLCRVMKPRVALVLWQITASGSSSTHRIYARLTADGYVNLSVVVGGEVTGSVTVEQDVCNRDLWLIGARWALTALHLLCYNCRTGILYTGETTLTALPTGLVENHVIMPANVSVGDCKDYTYFEADNRRLLFG